MKNQWYIVSQILLEQNSWQAFLLLFLPTKLTVLIKIIFFISLKTTKIISKIQISEYASCCWCSNQRLWWYWWELDSLEHCLRYFMFLRYLQYYYYLPAAFAVVPTDTICGWSLSYKITVDMNNIFMKMYITWPTWPKSHMPQKYEFSKWFL
jgi:hypothetical protein